MLVGSAINENGFYQLLAKSRGQSGTGASNANMIGCGPGPAAAARRAQGVNAWRYVYAGEYPNQDIGFPGSYHGSEIGLVFGSTEFNSRRPDVPEEVELSRRVRRVWTEFAKDPVNGLVKLNLPLYDPAGKYLAF
jgi:cholinesterase